MPLPGSFESLVPPGEDWLVREVQELKRQVAELVAQDSLRTAGLAAEPNLLRVLGSLQVEGDLAVPNGSITNAALASPVAVDAKNFGTGVTPFATSTTPTNYAGVTFTVPAGFTKAAIIAVSAVTSFVRFHTCATVIGASAGDYVECGIDDAGASAHTQVVTGLTGGSTVSVYTQIRASASGGFCHAMTTAMATFYR